MAKKELINASLGDPLFPFSKALRHAQSLVADNSRTYHFNTTSPIVGGEYRDACTPIKTHFTSMGFKSKGYNGVILPDIMPVDGGTSIYVAVTNGAGTPTFTAAGVKLRFGIVQG